MTAPLKPLGVERARWVVSEHAVDRFLERVCPGVPRERVRGHLVQQCQGAHYVKTLASGLEQWRGPKPRRMRLRVQRDGESLILATVLEAFDGLRRC